MTLFDFDCCGLGWRAYDLSVFSWAASWENAAVETWTAFLTGYSGQRFLKPVDQVAIQSLACVRQIWFMGLRMANGPQWGYSYPGMTQEIKFLHRLVKVADQSTEGTWQLTRAGLFKQACAQLCDGLPRLSGSGARHAETRHASRPCG
jgi:Ser/Thr protein kinase RdoA (MazF antagonist)